MNEQTTITAIVQLLGVAATVIGGLFAFARVYLKPRLDKIKETADISAQEASTAKTKAEAVQVENDAKTKEATRDAAVAIARADAAKADVSAAQEEWKFYTHRISWLEDKVVGLDTSVNILIREKLELGAQLDKQRRAYEKVEEELERSTRRHNECMETVGHYQEAVHQIASADVAQEIEKFVSAKKRNGHQHTQKKTTDVTIVGQITETGTQSEPKEQE